jgi:hypothetical protein
MASAEPPGWYSVWKVFARRGEEIYIIDGDSSFELVRDPAGVWRFQSELDLRDEEGERRCFDPATTYPQEVAERVARVAELVRAYCEVEVDERIGVAAFDRLLVGPKRN